MTEERHPAFTYSDEPIVPGDIVGVPAHDPQGTTSPARYAKGTLGAEMADLVEALEGDRDNWRRIALQKDRQLIKLLAQVAQLQTELREVLGATKREADEHDRS